MSTFNVKNKATGEVVRVYNESHEDENATAEDKATEYAAKLTTTTGQEHVAVKAGGKKEAADDDADTSAADTTATPAAPKPAPKPKSAAKK